MSVCNYCNYGEGEQSNNLYGIPETIPNLFYLILISNNTVHIYGCISYFVCIIAQYDNFIEIGFNNNECSYKYKIYHI